MEAYLLVEGAGETESRPLPSALGDPGEGSAALATAHSQKSTDCTQSPLFYVGNRRAPPPGSSWRLGQRQEWVPGFLTTPHLLSHSVRVSPEVPNSLRCQRRADRSTGRMLLCSPSLGGSISFCPASSTTAGQHCAVLAEGWAQVQGMPAAEGRTQLQGLPLGGRSGFKSNCSLGLGHDRAPRVLAGCG